MCKIYVQLRHMKDTKKELKFLGTISELLTSHDSHGFGWLGYHPAKKQIIGEKWLNVQQRWTTPEATEALPPEVSKLWGDAIDDSETKTELYKNINGGENHILECPSIIFHARYATSEKCLRNTHPFVNDTNTIGIVHNGVITQYGNNLPTTDITCDSYAILQLIERHGSNKKAKHLKTIIEETIDDISGSYAIAGIYKGRYFITKNDRTALYFSLVNNEIEVFCTSKDIIKEVCKKYKLPFTPPLPVNNDKLLLWDNDGKQFRKVIDVEDMPYVYNSNYYRNPPTTAQSIQKLNDDTPYQPNLINSYDPKQWDQLPNGTWKYIGNDEHDLAVQKELEEKAKSGAVAISEVITGD